MENKNYKFTVDSGPESMSVKIIDRVNLLPWNKTSGYSVKSDVNGTDYLLKQIPLDFNLPTKKDIYLGIHGGKLICKKFNI